MRANVALLLVLAACSRNKEPSPISTCRAASSKSPSEQVIICTEALMPACAPTVRAAETASPCTHAYEVADRCAPVYCARLKDAPAWCQGQRDSPSTPASERADLEVLASIFVDLHGFDGADALNAYVLALKRCEGQLRAEQRARQLSFERQVRLLIDLDLDGDELVIEFSHRGTSVASWHGTPEPADCDRLVSASLDGGMLTASDTVLMTSNKEVTFKSIKCVTWALSQHGLAENNLQFKVRP